ncbi:hypothetical protein F4X86_03740 [Candidatus Saccharibacteria bacterium]|nr:hypothetical protein [Candidatus Saccharibacteria bacterium]
MKAKIIALSLACFFSFGLVFAAPVSAQVDCGSTDLTPVQQVSCGVQAANPNVDPADSESQVVRVITVAIDLLSVAVGVISVIVIIIQGMRLILSGGNEKTTKEARNGIIYALVGLVVVALAQSMVWLVLDRIS